MNEKDPYEKLSQSPVLSPETVAPKRVEVVPSSEGPEQTVSKNTRGTKILVGSLAALLLVGGVTIGILAKTGAFSKEKKETTAETAESVISETTPETKTDDPGTGESTTAQKGPHKSILSLSQVTDEQISFMDDESRKHILEEDEFSKGKIPDKVSIDGMYYLGMLRQRVDYASDNDKEHDMIQMVYQVQVTDNTGDEPIKRQYYWMCGFIGVYQDGTIDPTMTDPMWSMVCFDNWSSQGCLGLQNLIREAEERYTLRENGLDYSRLQPFDGEYDETPSLVTSLDQITKSMEESLKIGSENWQYIANITPGTEIRGVKIEKVEYAGLALTHSEEAHNNRVYVIYKLDVTDLNQTPPVSRSIYWYTNFMKIYEGGQIQTKVIESLPNEASDLSEWLDGPATIEELRDFIKTHEYWGWDYEDNFGDDTGNAT